MPLTGHPIFKVGTSNTPRKPIRQQEEHTMPQTIIKAVSPSPEPEEEEEEVSSSPPMPLANTTNDSNPTAESDDAPILSKTTSANANKYTPPQYQPPSNTTELPDATTATTPLTETEDTKEAQEEHEPLLPLINEQDNQSTPRNTGAFILLWIVAIVLAPLAVAMCYAAYCIFLEFSLERWLAVMPKVPFLGAKTAKEIGEAAVEELVSEGHVEL